jgi:hypothetical protein
VSPSRCPGRSSAWHTPRRHLRYPAAPERSAHATSGRQIGTYGQVLSAFTDADWPASSDRSWTCTQREHGRYYSIQSTTKGNCWTRSPKPAADMAGIGIRLQGAEDHGEVTAAARGPLPHTSPPDAPSDAAK